MSIKTLLITLGFSSIFSFSPFMAQASTSSVELTAEQALTRAKELDLWLIRSQYQQQSLEYKEGASSSLPDPKVSLDLLNVSSESMDFSQEPMSQFKLGVSQMIPRGSSRALRGQRYSLQAEQKYIQRQERSANLAVQVMHVWLDAYKAKQSLILLEKNRSLFLELVDVAEKNYSTAYGKTKQQDVVRAQLELTRLSDRVTVIQERYDRATSKLSEWLITDELMSFEVSGQAPEIILLPPAESYLKGELLAGELLEILQEHPHIKDIDQQIKLRHANIDLVKQQYKPQWGIRASYAYREDDPAGRERDDLLSVGVTFDLPLFTSNKQDKQVQAERLMLDADKTGKLLEINKMLAKAKSMKDRLLRLNQRQSLYKNILLSQMGEQAESSLAAYISDNGDFSEVARARISELNAKIEEIDISVERYKAMAYLNYLFTFNVSAKEEDQL